MIYTQSTHSISSTTPNDYTVPRHLYKVQFSDHVTSFPAIMTQQFSHTAFTYLVSTSVLNIWINPKTKTFSGLFHRHKMKLSVPDPDLEIWGGNRSSRPLDKGGGGGDRSPKFFFSALRASVSSKTKGEGPSLWIRHCLLTLLGLFTNQKDRFCYLFTEILQLLKSPAFHIPEAWKRYPSLSGGATPYSPV